MVVSFEAVPVKARTSSEFQHLVESPRGSEENQKDTEVNNARLGPFVLLDSATREVEEVEV